MQERGRGGVATGTPLDVVHLLVEPVITVGVAVFTYTMARPVSLRPGWWAVGAGAVSFTLHRLRELVSSQVDLLAVAARGGSSLWAVLLEFSASALVFVGAPFVVYALVAKRPPILDGDRR